MGRREVVLHSPWFRGASAISRDELLDDFGLLPGLRPNLTLTFDAHGQGELELAADLGCPGTRTVERQFVGHAGLRSQATSHRFVFRSPCWPRYVRFQVRLRHACAAERSANRRAGCGPGWPRATERAAVVLGNWRVRLEQAASGGGVAVVDFDEVGVPGLSRCDDGRPRNPWSACR